MERRLPVLHLATRRTDPTPGCAEVHDEAARAVAGTDDPFAAGAEIDALYRAAPIGIAFLDRALRFVRINARLAEMNGAPAAAHLGRTVRDMVPDLEEQALAALRRVIESGEPLLDVEFVGETPARPGLKRTWIEQWHPLRDALGAVVGVCVMADEVTEERLADRRLRAAHATFRTLVERSPFGVYVVDADFRLAFVSDGARKVFAGVSPLIGRDFAEVLRIVWPEPFATEAIGRFRRTLETGVPYHAPDTVERRNDLDAVEAYDWKIERIELTDGRLGVVCHFYDLSERQAHEAALREADARKDEFLAVLSHELRNPLTPIPLCLKVLDREALTDRGRQATQVIVRQVAQMRRLVDDLLEVSRIARGGVDIRPQRVSVQQAVRAAAESQRPAIEQRDQCLRFDVPPEPLWACVDPVRLAQIVDNLVVNASKFTDPGGAITVRVADDGDAVSIAVQDTGCGIAPEHLHRIFDLFVQLGTGGHAAPGLGIGLALVRQLVELQGGRVHAASDGPGTGATFTVRLPKDIG